MDEDGDSQEIPQVKQSNVHAFVEHESDDEDIAVEPGQPSVEMEMEVESDLTSSNADFLTFMSLSQPSGGKRPYQDGDHESYLSGDKASLQQPSYHCLGTTKNLMSELAAVNSGHLPILDPSHLPSLTIDIDKSDQPSCSKATQRSNYCVTVQLEETPEKCPTKYLKSVPSLVGGNGSQVLPDSPAVCTLLPDFFSEGPEECAQSILSVGDDYGSEMPPSHALASRASCSQLLDDEFAFSEDYLWACGSDEECTDSPPTLHTFMDCAEFVDEVEEDNKERTPDMGAEKRTTVYHEASFNVWESLVSILTFVQCEHISGTGLRRLLELINLHLPQPNNFMKTHEKLFKLIEDLDEPVNIHYYCSGCNRTRKSATDLCDLCKDEGRSVLFYITFPLAPQLSKMFQRPKFLEYLKHRHTRVKENLNNIEDIYDGEIYKELKDFLASQYNISLMWNTDGVQVFKSNNFSLWPFYLVVNELPPDKRFLSENLLIAGLWGSVTKPHPNVFLLPIYKEIKTLLDGIEIRVHGETEIQRIRAKVTCGTCDAPATATFMNMKMHSGFYSCPVCIIRGEKPGDAVVFPYEDVPLRNMEDYEEHKRLAVEKKVVCTKYVRGEELCRGIKGPTVLSAIVPDIFKSMAIDAMHCVYLGVMRQMLVLWFDKDYKGEDYSVYSKIKLVSHRLQELAPPHFLQRLPQSIEKLIYWKATELESFLFNLSLPLLQDVLNGDVYNHFSLFVHGVALLNTSSVSHDDLALSSRLLSQFVQQFSSFYGVNEMSHNLHMLLHLSRCVQLHGPLWSFTCYKFEDINGRLLNLIHGTRHVGLQIHSNMSMITGLPLMIASLKESNFKQYCKSLIRKRLRLHVTDKISPAMYCVGKFSSVSDNESWVLNLLLEEGVSNKESSVQMFSRLLKNNVQFVSAYYKRGGRVSSYVKYVDDTVKYGNIQFFLKVTCSFTAKVVYIAVIKRLSVSTYQTDAVTVTHLFQCNPHVILQQSYDIVFVHNLLKVMFKIQCAGNVYLSEPLNKFELE